VIGRAEHMHLIMDAERDATLKYLDDVTRNAGGRRGRKATATETGGLTYAHTRHATSRAGDPCPHDHVLLANLVEMRDERGGWKAADTALWREHLHAATMVGRVAAARVVVELGYAIEADPGPSGRLRHWRIGGIPGEVIDMHSKRAAEIDAECQRRGDDSYRARRVAARTTRRAKEHGVEGELVGRWQAELASIGWPVERLAASVDAAARKLGAPPKLSLKRVRRMFAEVLSGDGELARRKVFARRHVLVEVAQHLFGHDPRLLDLLVDRALQDPEMIPLVGVAGAREQPYALASVLATEQAVANAVARQVERSDAPTASVAAVDRSIAAAEQTIGACLSAEQRRAVASICTSGRGAELIVGVAGAGKTTMLQVVAAAYEASGCQVIGTATSGQAARTLGREAEIGVSRTLASLLWRLDQGRLILDERTVVILDEVGMTEDAHLVALTARVEAAGAKLVTVGDHHQLGAVGPGGALAALVRRHPGVVHHLTENRRQHDEAERRALAELRNGDVRQASTGMTVRVASTLSLTGTTPSNGRSTVGQLTLRLGTTRVCTPGDEPTSKPSTIAPGHGWRRRTGSQAPNWCAPAATPIGPAIRLLLWRPDPTAASSPRSEPWSTGSILAARPSSCAPTTARRSSLEPTMPASTVSDTVTPQQFTAAKDRPATAPICSPTEADENSPTWP
jgi:hypothetical protein